MMGNAITASGEEETFFFFQAEDGIRDSSTSRGLGDVYKRQILFHSALSPYINLGLITPEFVVQKVLDFHKKNKIRMNSLEGYIRQVIGWREFMRGIYQSYSREMENGNFFKQNRKMKKSWYEGTTGLPPLDYAINNCIIKRR